MKGWYLALMCLCFQAVVLADEWGSWGDLPNNLLESDRNVRTLNELSEQLDQLIQQNREVDDSLRQQLLRYWLDQLETGHIRSISLDRLLEMSEDWEAQELSEWFQTMEETLSDQPELQLEDNPPMIEEEDDIDEEDDMEEPVIDNSDDEIEEPADNNAQQEESNGDA